MTTTPRRGYAARTSSDLTDALDGRDAPQRLVPQLGQAEEPGRVDRSAVIGLVLGPVLAVVVYFLLPEGDGGLSTAGRATVAIGLLMAVWWVTEPLPLAVTSLLPLVLFPLFGVLPIEDAAAPFADDLIFLFLGGFVIALAMQRWGLHRRIALVTVQAVGTKPARVVGGFMIATAFLSMWVSNTATTVMMLPVAVSVLALALDPDRHRGNGSADGAGSRSARRDDEGYAAEPDGAGPGADGAAPGESALEEGGATATDITTDDSVPRETRNFATALMLGVAYAASIGSLATLIGTPPNVFMAAFLQDQYDVTLGFGRWMAVGLPLAVVFLVIAWLVLTRFVFRVGTEPISGGRELVRDQLREMGPMSRGEKTVGVVFVVTALAWVFREPYTALLDGVLPGLTALSDTGIAIAAAIVLFILPVDRRRGVFTMDWETAKELPWSVLLLFGGGLSLAAAVSENGVDVWVGDQVSSLGVLPSVLLVAIVAAIVLGLTELTSNTATAAAILPVLAGVAVGLGFTAPLLVIPAALAASCAFMLPVATPPNAIVFGSGHVTIGQMVRGGLVLNVVGVVLITATVYLLAAPIFGLAL